MSSSAREEMGWVGPQCHGVTPILTPHARERCAEMGISTKVAKRIWQHRQLVRAVQGETRRAIVTSDVAPEYALVVDLIGWGERGSERPAVITIMFASPDKYVREGTTYRVVE